MKKLILGIFLLLSVVAQAQFPRTDKHCSLSVYFPEYGDTSNYRVENVDISLHFREKRESIGVVRNIELVMHGKQDSIITIVVSPEEPDVDYLDEYSTMYTWQATAFRGTKSIRISLYLLMYEGRNKSIGWSDDNSMIILFYDR